MFTMGNRSGLEKIIEIRGKRFLFKVEDSDRSDDYLKYEELRNDIWGFPEDNLPGCRNMMCENYLHEGSSLFIDVYVEDEAGRFQEDKEHLAAFSYGFVGVKDKAVAFKSLDNLWFYSQYTGARPDFQGCGLGIPIKEFQREVVADVFGVDIITCTYDPLTGVNALRNVHYFGMDVLEYRTATYGEYGGFLNRLDVPTDRFFMSWDLRRKAARPAYSLKSRLDVDCRVIDVEEKEIAGRSQSLSLEVAKAFRLNSDHDVLFVRIPRDFYLMLDETDVADPAVRGIPVGWRMKTREAFLSLLGRGYKIVDFQSVRGRASRSENYYVLKKGISV